MSYTPPTKEEALKQITNLVNRFDEQRDTYIKNFNETQVRRDFIDPLWEALGWDVSNKNKSLESYREVIMEDKVNIKGTTKNPDYSFKLPGGKILFYLEAKKPSVNILEDPAPAIQVRDYGWNKNLQVSILTNFDNFAIYDCSYNAKHTDKATTGLIQSLNYKEYITKFDFLWDTFSRLRVQQGGLDKYIQKDISKKGTMPVDEKLLSVIENWRIDLAKNIAINNPDLSIYNLNMVVQKIIDRIIFIRIAEDRGIEDEDLLLSISNANDIYERLNHVFTKVNIKYNSEIFAYQEWEEKIKIDDKILINIITNLYRPKCSFLFSVIPVEILGSIYERFLGSTIHFRNIKGDSRTAIIEQKPEVKKAGGVFYTPQYIVDFIVKNTVGEKIKNKKPEDISKIKIIDPSCGSGSFLVGAYQFLLNYHLDYYSQSNNAASALKNRKIFSIGNNSYRLTIEEKQRILINNIYGVDIDNQAVEVTKLSLYLKLLESEEKGWLINYADRALLPILETNIKCGNSLVGTDYYAQGDLDFSDEERIKVNCFDWEQEFADIFKDGGFDVVIGNPPYFNIQTLGAGSEVAQYIQKKYSNIWQDKSDILFYFLVKAMQISKDSIGFILSNAFLFSDKAQKLRNKIIEDGRLAKIINFEQFMVFEGASITTGIFLFNKDSKKTQAAVLKDKKYKITELIEYINTPSNYFNIKLETNSVFALVDSRTDKLNKKIDGKHPLLQDILLIGKGMETAANEVFLFDKPVSKFPKKYFKKRMVGENINRYFLKDEPEYLLYFEDIDDLKKLPIAIQDHLKENRKILKDRATVKNEGRIWWRYSRPMHKEYYHLPKIWCSYRSKNNAFILDETDDYIGLTNTTVIFGTNEKYLLKYILAILNSKLFAYRYKALGKQTGSGVFEYLPNSIGKFPIPETDKQIQEKFIPLVDKIMELKKREAAEPNPQQRTMITRQIEGIDKEINKLVYEHYGLSEEEIGIVEGK